MSANPLLSWEYYLGEPLLRFVLNKDTGPLEELSEPQQQVLHMLDSGGVFGAADDPRPPVALSRVDGDGLPRSWRLREQCGGVVPDPIGDDEIVRGLTLIARDTYSILLSPPDLMVQSGPGRSLPASDPLIGLSHAVSAHPATPGLEDLIAAESKGWESVLVESAMERRWLLEAPTPDSVLGAAAERWRHRRGADVGDFMQEVVGCIAELRQLGTGQAIDVPAVIGLRGLELEGSREYRLPFGLLRPPTEDERHFAPFMEPAANVEAVLATTIQLRVSDDGDKEPEAPALAQRKLSELARAISLASAMARRGRGGPLSAVAIAWITEATPFAGSGAFKPGPISEHWVPSNSHGENEVAELAQWANRILAANLSHVEIAVERLLRALSEIEWGEALIDAVIAWENLVGTRNETVYRVTAALTVLCEDDPALRLERQKELEGIYDKRSRMVHGDAAGAEPELRNRAIQIGLEALARLIVDRPALLELAKSRKRADRLLLAVKDPGDAGEAPT